MPVNNTDIAVVGGGIMGCSTAYHLAKRGASVTLFERNPGVGLEASGTNAGSICIQNKPFNLIHMAIAAADEWQGLSAELGRDIGYHRVGGLRIAENEDQLKKLRGITDQQREHGLPVEWLSASEVRDMAPYLTGEFLGANYCSLDGHADSLLATDQIARAAVDRGATIRTGTEISGIEPVTSGGFRLQWANGSASADRVIIAGGMWSRKLAGTLGIDLPLKLRINQIMIAQRSPKVINHMITHADGNLTLKQLDAGTIVIGGGLQGHGALDGPRPSPSLKGLLANAHAAFRIMPELGDLQIIRSWAGFDGRTIDQLPILGELPGHPGLHVITSCFGGFVVGPLVGRLLSEKLIDGRTSMPIDEFSYERYLTGEAKATNF